MDVQCVKCGESLREDWDSCPYCGAEQPAVAGFFSRLLGFLTPRPRKKSGRDQFARQVPGSSPQSSPQFGGRDDFAPGGDAFAGDGEFFLEAEEIIPVPGRGSIVRGHVHGGPIRVGDIVEFETRAGDLRRCEVSSLETDSNAQDQAAPGDEAILILLSADAENLPEEVILRKPAFDS